MTAPTRKHKKSGDSQVAPTIKKHKNAAISRLSAYSHNLKNHCPLSGKVAAKLPKMGKIYIKITKNHSRT